MFIFERPAVLGHASLIVTLTLLRQAAAHRFHNLEKILESKCPTGTQRTLSKFASTDVISLIPLEAELTQDY